MEKCVFCVGECVCMSAYLCVHLCILCSVSVHVCVCMQCAQEDQEREAPFKASPICHGSEAFVWLPCYFSH